MQSRWSAEEWLESFKLKKYAAGFIDNGYDTRDLCAIIGDEDLDAIGVTIPHHRAVLFKEAQKLLAREPPPMPHLSSHPSRCDNTAAQQTHPLPFVMVEPTSDYTEPWRQSVEPGYAEPWSEVPLRSAGAGNVDVADGGEEKKKKKKKKKAASTSQVQQSPVHSSVNNPPAVMSPTLLPYHKEGGGKGLTKLQLKLKIKEELQRDKILLSEPPYCTEDGSADENLLLELAEAYASRFQVESLDVHEALLAVWKHVANTSPFVISLTSPTKNSNVEVSNTEQPKPEREALSVSSLSAYDEPFDTKVHTPKSKTLPAPSRHYDEPFEGDLSNTSPNKQRKSGSPMFGRRSSGEESDGSAHSQGSNASGRRSPFRFFGRSGTKKSPMVSRVQSMRETTMKTTNGAAEVKIRKPLLPSSSHDDISLAKKGNQNRYSLRASVPLLPNVEGNHVKRNRTRSSTSSFSEDVPKSTKNHSRSESDKPYSTSSQQMSDLSSEDSCSSLDNPHGAGLDHGSQLGLHAHVHKSLTSSNLELNKVSNEEPRHDLRASSSHGDILASMRIEQQAEEEKAREKKRKGLMSKLFKRRTVNPGILKRENAAKKKEEKKQKKKSAMSVKVHSNKEERKEEKKKKKKNRVPGSTSLPEISVAAVRLSTPDSGYSEVFDAIVRGGNASASSSGASGHQEGTARPQDHHHQRPPPKPRRGVLRQTPSPDLMAPPAPPTLHEEEEEHPHKDSPLSRSDNIPIYTAASSSISSDFNPSATGHGSLDSMQSTTAHSQTCTDDASADPSVDSLSISSREDSAFLLPSQQQLLTSHSAPVQANPVATAPHTQEQKNRPSLAPKPILMPPVSQYSPPTRPGLMFEKPPKPSTSRRRSKTRISSVDSSVGGTPADEQACTTALSSSPQTCKPKPPPKPSPSSMSIRRPSPPTSGGSGGHKATPTLHQATLTPASERGVAHTPSSSSSSSSSSSVPPSSSPSTKTKANSITSAARGKAD